MTTRGSDDRRENGMVERGITFTSLKCGIRDKRFLSHLVGVSSEELEAAVAMVTLKLAPPPLAGRLRLVLHRRHPSHARGLLHASASRAYMAQSTSYNKMALATACMQGALSHAPGEFGKRRHMTRGAVKRSADVAYSRLQAAR